MKQKTTGKFRETHNSNLTKKINSGRCGSFRTINLNPQQNGLQGRRSVSDQKKQMNAG